MSPETRRPAHVPPELVRHFAIDFRGPLDDLFPRLDALRSEGRALWLDNPMALSPSGGPFPGVWLFTEGEDVRAALQHPDLFSSRLDGLDGQPVMIPIFLDPPDHTRYRRLLNPLFSPGVVQAMEASIRTRMHNLVEGIADTGSCDFVADVAVQFPTRVFTSWVGLPEEETGRFVSLVSGLIHAGKDPTERDTAMIAAFEILNQLISDRTAAPRDDLISKIIEQPLDDRPLTHDELLRIAFLLFLAGLDTVAAALSFSFWHLARTPDDRRAISTGEVAVGDAVEELLRRHSFVNPPRLVAHDTEFAGVQLKAGDPVLLLTTLASRDPHEYDDPTDVHLDRRANRNYAFGVGPHRCLGSHLARLEMRIALEEWHARIPDYQLDGEVGAYGGIVMGVSALPLRW